MKIKKGTEFNHFGNKTTVMHVVGEWAMVQTKENSTPFVVKLSTVARGVIKGG